MAHIGFGDFDCATTGVVGYANLMKPADGSFAKGGVVRIANRADVFTLVNEMDELVYEGSERLHPAGARA